MNKKVWIYSAIGAVGSLAIAGSFTINNTLAQTNQFPPELHHPGLNVPAQTQPTPPSSETNGMGQMMHRDIDQHFIVMMIPHHQGAVDMAELALTRAQRPEIKQLAEAIIRDQNREIEQMQTWYRDWYGSDVPDMVGMMGNSSFHENSMDHQAMMPGHSSQEMMGHQQGQSVMSGTSGQGMMEHHNGQGMMAMRSGMMGDLETLSNADDFDQEFTRQMIPHHQMAVMMAQMVADTANQPEIRDLAQTIITTQTAEINQMQQWSQEWFQ